MAVKMERDIYISVRHCYVNSLLQFFSQYPAIDYCWSGAAWQQLGEEQEIDVGSS